jgi:hypothetical protein
LIFPLGEGSRGAGELAARVLNRQQGGRGGQGDLGLLEAGGQLPVEPGHGRFDLMDGGDCAVGGVARLEAAHEEVGAVDDVVGPNPVIF